MSNQSSQRLIVFGAPASQPSRAVYWTCLLKQLPFELRQPDFFATGPSELARHNPKRQVPTIVDGDFALYEMPAILVYLCEKHGWDDLYPRDLAVRAVTNQYLHFHHSSTRLATLKLMAPHVTIAFPGFAERVGAGGDGSDNADRGMDESLSESIRLALAAPDKLERGQATLGKVAGMIETGYLRGDSAFLAGTPGATIADIACYEELAQLRWANLFDFAGYPKLTRWLSAMAELPFHEPAHRYNVVLGDIQTEANTMERFLEASAAGVAALEELGIPAS